MSESTLLISDLERLERDEWIHANESKLKKLSERHALETRAIAIRFGIPEAERRLKRLLQKKAPGPAPISQKIVNGVRVTVYEPSVNPELKRRVRKITIGETDSLERLVLEDEDGSEIMLRDTLGE